MWAHMAETITPGAKVYAGSTDEVNMWYRDWLHFIREKILSGDIATGYVKSNDQLTNIFTKSLAGPQVNYICNKLGTYNLYAPARGGVLDISV